MIVHSSQGVKVMEAFILALGDTVTVESHIKMEGRQLFATVAPKKQIIRRLYLCQNKKTHSGLKKKNKSHWHW